VLPSSTFAVHPKMLGRRPGGCRSELAEYARFEAGRTNANVPGEGFPAILKIVR
jgi:hypothetical protein